MGSNKNPAYQKHLSLLDREDIERLLKDGFKFYQIADRIRKHPTSIPKEILNNRVQHRPSNYNNKTNYCKNKNSCTLTDLCTSRCHTECRRCGKCNIDLPRRVKYKVRNKDKNKKKTKKDYSYRVERTYEDFKEILEENPNINVVEMDTVEGIKGGKVLLTLIFRNFNFMIARLLPDKTSKSVKKELDKIEKLIGTELYKRVFKCILTDNGGEFERPNELETSTDGSKRSWIYYCDANRSDQKAKVEKNHEYIRYIIPKGTSMDKYQQSDMDLMMSHINSTAREILNFAIPYDMASIYLGVDALKKLKLSKIQPDDIILKPYLINNKK